MALVSEKKDVFYTEPMLEVEGSLWVPGAMKNWTPCHGSPVRFRWDHRTIARCSRQVELGPAASSSPEGGPGHRSNRRQKQKNMQAL